MTGKQPADFMWIYHGKMWFIECKSTTRPLPMTIGDKNCNFKPHQLVTGSKIAIEGHPNIIHVHFIAYYPPLKKTPPQAWVIPTALLFNYYSGYRKSIPLSFITSYGTEVPRLKYQRWALFEALTSMPTQVTFATK